MSRSVTGRGLAAAPRGIDGIVRRVEARAGWTDLILPERERRLVASIIDQLRRRPAAHVDTGCAVAGERGLGIAALFTGPSGTGKTQAAEVIAGELGLDLYRIDVGALVSKYIGETEKNLRHVFDAAGMGGAVLLFDEADALFGRRGGVEGAHDRYANLATGYLLGRIEAYEGLTILTTNLADDIDPAFRRRLRFVVRFRVPDPDPSRPAPPASRRRDDRARRGSSSPRRI